MLYIFLMADSSPNFLFCFIFIHLYVVLQCIESKTLEILKERSILSTLFNRVQNVREKLEYRWSIKKSLKYISSLDIFKNNIWLKI